VNTEVLDVSAPARRCDRARLEVHLPAARHEQVATALARYLASLADIDPAARDARLESGPLPVVDWETVFREHHRPLCVGRRLLVAPPWDVPLTSGREVLVIEPGMAFGTGQHATTRGCLEEIEEATLAGGVGSALDVGTGSGLLAAALVRLGVPRVVACDADPAVMSLARANLDRNGAARALLFAGRAEALRARFDLVVANLFADALVAGAPALTAAVSPRGRLVLSGLLTGQTEAVCSAYPEWWVTAERASDGWRTLRLARADV
jgi:ribosomal protein L11 methyltransferase